MALATRLRQRGGATPTPDAMTLAQHSGELRRRLLITIAAFLIAAVVAFFFYDQILNWLQPAVLPCRTTATARSTSRPPRRADPADQDRDVRRPVPVGLAGDALWELWRFITPGLKHNERRYAVPFIVASMVLFGAGARWRTSPSRTRSRSSPRSAARASSRSTTRTST